jgi:hypothetical protein
MGSVGLSNAPHRAAFGSSIGVKPADSTHESKTENVEIQNGDDVELLEETEHDGQEEKAAGVIRLLESGHFKGVADVRLRINFHDELSARATERSLSAVNEAAEDFVDDIQAEIESITALQEAESEAGAENAVSVFEVQVRDSIQTSLSGGEFDLDGLEDSFRSAFEQLASTLLSGSEEGEDPASELIRDAELDSSATATPESAPSEETGEVSQDDPTLVEAASGAEESEDPLAAFSAYFEEALSDLLSAFGESTVSSVLSPTNGNGTAYQKFLLAYDALPSLYGSFRQDA